jgi:hypothetical protein
VYCSACYGSPHAEYPTLQANDNLYSQQLQGYTGQITDCAVCHTNVPTTANGGPHNLHDIGQSWANGHGARVEQDGIDAYAYCNRSNFRASFLSKTSMARTFNADHYGTKTYDAGDMVPCYDCHNRPNGD